MVWGSYVKCVQYTRKPFEPFEHFFNSAMVQGFEADKTFRRVYNYNTYGLNEI